MNSEISPESNKLRVIISIVSHYQDHLISNFFYKIDRNVIINSPYSFAFIITYNKKKEINHKKEFNFFNISEIENDTSQSFGKNHNQAFNFIKSDLFIVANPDIEFFKGNINDFIFEFVNSEHSLLVPQIIEPKKEAFIPLRNRLSFLELVKRFFKMVIFRKKSTNFEGFNEEKVFWACGIFMLFNSNIYKEIQGFDESIFMYYEDADISRRLNLLGKTINFSKTLTIKHIGTRSSHKNLCLLFSHIYNAIRVNFYRKWEE